MKSFLEKEETLLKVFGTNKEQGLTDAQAKQNADTYGRNSFAKEKPISIFRRIWEASTEPMLIMLILAALIALGVNIARAVTGGEAEFLECLGIFVAISISVVITVIMEGRSAKAFEALNRMNEDTLVRVIRNGQVMLLAQKEIVAGDIVCVETGDKITADGRVMESVCLYADESALTGESAPVEKDSEAVFTDESTPVADRINMLYSGCFITSGHGKMLVTEVGDHTEFGKIARALASTNQSSTPLQEKLDRLGKTITILGATAAAIVFLIQLAIFLINGTASLDTISEAFITSIVLIVAAVPEGLPTIVAVSLSINIIKMSKQNALVKKMIACETVGCINVICSDKTGTLTENKMTVTAVGSGKDIVCPSEVQSRLLLENFCVNSTAELHTKDGVTEFIGNPTEGALLIAAEKAGVDYQYVRSAIKAEYVYPFSSETKNMTSIVWKEEERFIFTKGSPEKVLEMCTMTAEEKEAAEGAILEYQKQACRVIAFAHRELKEEICYECDRRQVERNLIYDGFTAIMDPLREDVYDAVKKCNAAGVELKMLTGDNLVTAVSIAKQLHLLDGDHIAVEAKALEQMSDEELKEVLPKVKVIARSTPLIKMRVVKVLKECGNIVAVTGDGINDAPAIKQADVGIAMGIAGTEVSKEASDIVLLDDSFSTIVKAVKWGRGIYENFQRFIQFQLTVNLSSVIVVLASILLGFKSPFTALQLLWINIIMDGPPALTLGLEPIREDLMNREPTKRDSSIITKRMLVRIAVNGIYISIVFLFQHTVNFMGASAKEMPTVLFTLFVVFQLCNALNSRELNHVSVLRSLVNNKLMLLVFALTFTLQVVITQFGGAFFGTVALSLGMWLKIVGVSVTVVIVSEIRVLFARKLSH